MTAHASEVFAGATVGTADGVLDVADLSTRGPLIIACQHLDCHQCQFAAVHLACLTPALTRTGGAVLLVYGEPLAEVNDASAQWRTQALCASDPQRAIHTALAGGGSCPADDTASCVIDAAGSLVYRHCGTGCTPADEVTAAARQVCAAPSRPTRRVHVPSTRLLIGSSSMRRRLGRDQR
jgi:hypothetical protein